MNRFLLIASAIFCFYEFSFAQIKVALINKQTQAPVAYASIYYPDLKTGTTTDSIGNAIINVRQQKLLIQITAMGYNALVTTINTSQYSQTIFLEPSHLELDEVVISTYSHKLQSENVMNIASMKLNSIQNNSQLSLAEKLTTIPGVSQVSTGAGIGKLVIRGLSGNRIVVFSQGIRVENQQWGDEHGLGLDENGYESVEVIKGPASLLYGSDALGGVIYFVDKRYAQQNSIEGKINSQFSSNTIGLKNNGSFLISKNNFHWNVFGGFNTHKDYSDGNDVNIPNSRFNTADLKTALGFTKKNWSSALRYNLVNENYGLTELDSAQISDYDDARTLAFPNQHLQTHLISIENTLFIKDSKLKIDAGHIFNKRQEFEEEGDTHAALDLNLNTTSLNAKWYSPKVKENWNFIAGTQEMFQINDNRGEEILIPNSTIFDIGLFGTTTYHFAEKSNVEAGLRFDNRTIHSEQYGHFGEEEYKPEFDENYPSVNFSIGVVHQFKKYFSIRANLSSGFRAPNTFELLSDGVHEGTFRYEIGDVSLKSENSYQADVSLNFEVEHYQFFVNPFVNYIANYIYLNPVDSVIEEFPVYSYKQTNAVLAGGESGLHFHPHPMDWLHLEVSYSSVFGSDKHGNPLPLIPSQKINSALRADFKAKHVLKSFNAYVQHLYSFSQGRIAGYETATPSYHLLNAGVSFEFLFGKQKLLFNAGVSNMLNAAYSDHLSRYKAEGIYNIGRSFFAGVTIPFNFSL